MGNGFLLQNIRNTEWEIPEFETPEFNCLEGILGMEKYYVFNALLFKNSDYLNFELRYRLKSDPISLVGF